MRDRRMKWRGVEMYTKEQLVMMDKEQLVELVLNMQKVYEQGKNVVGYYNRTRGRSKFGDVTPELVAQLHREGYSLTDIKHKLDKEFTSKGLVDKNGKPLEISIQTLSYKLKKFEKENGVKIYKCGTKGRKKHS